MMKAAYIARERWLVPAEEQLSVAPLEASETSHHTSAGQPIAIVGVQIQTIANFDPRTDRKLLSGLRRPKNLLFNKK